MIALFIGDPNKHLRKGHRNDILLTGITNIAEKNKLPFYYVYNLYGPYIGIAILKKRHETFYLKLSCQTT